MNIENTKIHNTDVLVIGCGGSGLRAAIEARNNGANVIVLGKRIKTDAHTALAAGGINAAYGNVDKEDSWQQHFADTYLEGYEIGDPLAIEIMSKEAPEIVEEVDQWGANLARLKNGKFDQRFFGAHTYRRTCYAGDFTGKSILNALISKAEELEIPVFDNQYVTELLVEDNRCFGAFSLNIKFCERSVFLADAVILATGGYTRIWKRSSSRKQENTGDGIYLGLKAGCKLIDMEMVQFHPTGMLTPVDLEGSLVTEAVRGEGGKLLNNNKERFMKNYDVERMELSTRDRVAVAIYNEIIEGRGTENGGVYLDISHKEKEFIIRQIPEIYKKFLEYQKLDISKYPMEVAPTAHYSMGGIKVNPENHSTGVNGLYACGEVAGGLHGANRLGGNSLAEILIFGRRAGLAAAKFSKINKFKFDTTQLIKKASSNIDKLIKKGDENIFELEKYLYESMWKYCGVIKNETNLKLGLKEINNIESKLINIDINYENRNLDKLINLLNLKSSILSAKSTLLSAIERKESRGAHQRSDYKKKNIAKYNFIVHLNNDEELILDEFFYPNIDINLKKTVEKTRKIINFEKRLLE